MNNFPFLFLESDSSKSRRIKKMKENINKFKDDKKENNCQGFAACLELLISKGKKYAPHLCKTPYDIIFDVPPNHSYPYMNYCMMKSGALIKIEGNPKEFIKKIFSNLEDDSRIFLQVKWKDSNSGHVFNAWKCENEIYILDAVCNLMVKIDDSKYIKKIDSSDSYILICDPKSYDSKIIEKVISDKKWKYSLSKSNENNYESILHALGNEGKVNCKHTVFENGKEIGKIKCNKIVHIHDFKEYGKYIIWDYEWI